MALVKILLVSRDALFAEALGALLENTPLERGARVVGISRSDSATLRLLSDLAPDIVLIDSSRPGCGRSRLVDRAKLVKLACPDVKVLILQAFDAEPGAGKPGYADVYLSNITSAVMLLKAIEDIMFGKDQGGVHANTNGNGVDDSPGVATAAARRPPGETVSQGAAKGGALERDHEPATCLSARELLILGYMIQGRKNREIATLLARSIRTVENQRFSMLQKLGNPSPSQLIHIAMGLKMLG